MATNDKEKGHTRLCRKRSKQVWLFEICLLSYESLWCKGGGTSCPSLLQPASLSLHTAQRVQFSAPLLTGPHGVQSIELGAINILVDNSVSALVKENRHPFMERFSNSYKPYIVLPSATSCQANWVQSGVLLSEDQVFFNFRLGYCPGFYLVSSPIVFPFQPMQLTTDKLIPKDHFYGICSVVHFILLLSLVNFPSSFETRLSHVMVVTICNI